MPELNRYQNPVIVDHLASQFVLGLMSPLVRRRMESLCRRQPKLQEAVEFWQLRMAPMNHPTDLAPPKDVWNEVEQALFSPSTKAHRWQDWWQAPKWAWLTSSAFAMSLVLVAFLFFAPKPTVKSLDYVAMLADQNDDVSLVVSAFKGAKKGESTIRLQWHQSEENQDHILWSRLTDQTVVKLGRLGDVAQQEFLTGPQWQAIVKSDILFTTTADKPNQAILSGKCINLTESAQAGVGSLALSLTPVTSLPAKSPELASSIAAG